jgi:hypothetical protein
MARIRSERTKAVDDPTWDSIKAMFDHLIAEGTTASPIWWLFARRSTASRR